MIWIVPLILYLLILPFTPTLDLSIAHYFYGPDGFQKGPFFDFLFNYGVYPAHIVAWGGGAVFALSFWRKELQKFRYVGAYLALVLLIGSGVIVNWGLKEYWGRPRPKQIVQFGGAQEYRAVWQPNFNPPEPSKAFPCGHCSMGFYFFAVALAAYQFGRRDLAYAAFLFALIFGSALSYARMAQGGHFFSDVLTSALVMWLVAVACRKVNRHP